MKKNDDDYLTYTRLLQEQKIREAYSQYGHDGFINKATSNKPRPPKPQLGKDAFKSEIFLSMIGEQKKTS